MSNDARQCRVVVSRCSASPCRRYSPCSNTTTQCGQGRRHSDPVRPLVARLASRCRWGVNFAFPARACEVLGVGLSALLASARSMNDSAAAAADPPPYQPWSCGSPSEKESPIGNHPLGRRPPSNHRDHPSPLPPSTADYDDAVIADAVADAEGEAEADAASRPRRSSAAAFAAIAPPL